MQVQTLVLYVTNTGEFYQTNCKMAQDNASFQEWYDRTKRFLRRYRTEMREPHEGMSEDELQASTRELKAYYTRHIQEF